MTEKEILEEIESTYLSASEEEKEALIRQAIRTKILRRLRDKKCREKKKLQSK